MRPTPRTDAAMATGRMAPVRLRDLAYELEHELATATAKINQLTLNLHLSTEQERYSIQCRKEAQAEAEVMRAALAEIHTTAHCLAKAGPLSTPTLDDAWGHFLRIGVLATSGLAKAQETKREQSK